MGWTSFQRRLPVTETLAKEFQNDRWRIIDAAVVNRNEYYAAIEYVVDAGMYPKGYVTAIICALKHAPKSQYNFSYKDMDETMGPYYYNCPKRILDKLSPTDNEAANNWRTACRAQQAKVKPKAGQTVTFAEPITFTNGDKLTQFRYVSGSRFVSADNAFVNYRISGWKDRQYTVAA